jgi:hypothetical protein
MVYMVVKGSRRGWSCTSDLVERRWLGPVGAAGIT